MSKITSITIQEKNKNRCNIFIDGDFFMAVPLELVYKYSLRTELEIDKKTLSELAKEKDMTEALSKSITYVSKTLKTKKQVKTYLFGKGYSTEVVNYCISKLEEYRYIDDKEYAKRFIESTSSSQGKNLSQYKLMMKGVKKQDIENAFDNVQIDHNENALQLAIKRLKNKEITKDILAKTYRYLISKGFTYDQVSYAIDYFKEQINGTDSD